MEPARIRFRLLKNKLATAAIIALAFLPTIPLAIILINLFIKGITAINWEFLTSLPKPVGEEGGGVANAIVGTFILVLLASIISVPIGIMAGIYLSEYGGRRLPDVVRVAADILQGVPSIVIGIVAYTWVVVPMGRFSALAGGVALALMMIPVIVRTTEEVLILIPRSIREASLALGVPQWRTILKVVLPTGMVGVTTGILISVARVAGETAPLLFTAFGNPFWSHKLTEPINALPLVIFNYATSPYPDWWRQAWGASIILILLVLSLNIGSRILAKRIAGD
ncbi:phosphate ABC transporter permease PstA [Thermosulfuriphilus ammonigenes]|uniref:Phosphate transport system permease protein PstA n=1 Tax=Thermosulfuriphilus ammonigenes TaxID=1936021 RepID=A0A6G7PUG1_9BACT|nr:phosphate ABC transporter permease PstA [Thermosulfuriphilus ammonigenes]MBA2848794.1 phosphate transport system permease protein [Thermosulfuriphilus ammonigenes]QIJ71078.1 phosphate ABC transporter permease PstA [Thermosulfuriphilus ammonigenes]